MISACGYKPKKGTSLRVESELIVKNSDGSHFTFEKHGLWKIDIMVLILNAGLIYMTFQKQKLSERMNDEKDWPLLFVIAILIGDVIRRVFQLWDYYLIG